MSNAYTECLWTGSGYLVVWMSVIGTVDLANSILGTLQIFDQLQMGKRPELIGELEEALGSIKESSMSQSVQGQMLQRKTKKLQDSRSTCFIDVLRKTRMPDQQLKNSTKFCSSTQPKLNLYKT